MSGEVVWIAAGVAGWLLIALTLAPVVGRLLGGEPPMPPPDPAHDGDFDAHAELALWLARQDPDVTVNDVAAHVGLAEFFHEWDELVDAEDPS